MIPLIQEIQLIAQKFNAHTLLLPKKNVNQQENKEVQLSYKAKVIIYKLYRRDFTEFGYLE